MWAYRWWWQTCLVQWKLAAQIKEMTAACNKETQNILHSDMGTLLYAKFANNLSWGEDSLNLVLGMIEFCFTKEDSPLQLSGMWWDRWRCEGTSIEAKQSRYSAPILAEPCRCGLLILGTYWSGSNCGSSWTWCVCIYCCSNNCNERIRCQKNPHEELYKHGTLWRESEASSFERIQRIWSIWNKV